MVDDAKLDSELEVEAALVITEEAMDELLGMGIRNPPEHHGVQHAEFRGRYADPEGERDDRRCQKSRRLS